MKVRFVSQNFIFIRSAFYPCVCRFGSPFEGRRFPGIGFGDAAAASAGKDIPQKNELRRRQQQGGEGNAAFVGGNRREVGYGTGEAFVVARFSGETCKVHGAECSVGGDERDPEM